MNLQRQIHPGWLALVGLVAAGILLGWLFLNPQARNLRAARRHMVALQPIIRADPRFADVQLGAYTGGDGSLWVRGMVLDPLAGTDLRQIVEESDPGVQIWWTVEIWTGSDSVRMHEFLDGNPVTDEVERAIAGS